MLYRLAKILKWLLRPIFMWVKCDDKSPLNRQGAFIVCCNHVHALDPLSVADICPRKISFMAKQELFRNRLIAWFLTRLNAFPVDRQGSDIGAIKTALRRIKDGWALGIFPEGTRAKTDEMLPFHSGAALLALRTNVPVIPCAIDKHYRLFFVRIYMKVGQPMDFSDLLQNGKPGQEEYDIATERIRQEIYRLRDLAREERKR
ncbi:1-acyl-sn-glycerol-3-phosphate acyltransferase [Eubacteriales bacterium OttesenSCG-928-N14]|nr:1-acyl-sn-glycerol-3-phosphate acyltransferase [Eubacteriales bacterium OttesenSCG-928-N14]